MSETAKMNPLVGIAAASVTLVSLVGAGVLTGIIPTKGDKAPAATPVTATAPAAATVAPVAPVAVAPAPVAPVAPVAPAPAKQVAMAEPAPRPAPRACAASGGATTTASGPDLSGGSPGVPTRRRSAAISGDL